MLRYLGLGFLLASVISALPQPSTIPFTTDFQRSMYDRIQQERFHIYLLSLLFSLWVVRHMKRVWTMTRVVVMMTLTASLYMLVPKSAYMADYLDTHEQRMALRRVYRVQQCRYYGSIASAVIASTLLCS
jgi:hypothetical protein